MRLIQAIIPEGKTETIVDILKEKGIDYVISPETSQRKYSDVLFFPIPKEGVEEVLDELRKAGLEEDGFTIVTKAEAIVAKEFEELKERYAESEETDESKVARQELRAGVEKLSPSSPTYYLLLIAASIIASAGILMDNAAVVVGSMVIAPLIGPAMTSCVGTIINDRSLFYRGIKKQAYGVLLTVASSIAFSKFAMALLLPADLNLLSLTQITNQLNPGFLSLVVALGSGLAGAFSLTAGINSALVGVMISVALLPPAAAAGIGVATLNLKIAYGATILLFINVISINLAGTFTLWFQGYKPGKWYEQEGAKRATKSRLAVLITLLLIIATFLGFLTWDTRIGAKRSEELQAITQKVIKERELKLRSFEVERDGLFLRKITTVSLELGGKTYPSGLAEELDKQVEQKLKHPIELNLSFLQTSTS
ncbi:TIGR00341 family protein [Candidatus Bipolaricaulota bacterium]|nr:TIGR00341 family protein [Candidatus Bipolaricaulota bacterium]